MVTAATLGSPNATLLFSALIFKPQVYIGIKQVIAKRK